MAFPSVKKLAKNILPYVIVRYIRQQKLINVATQHLKSGNWKVLSRKSNHCVIIANGPSIAENHDTLTAMAKQCDVFTLNNSIAQNNYKQYKSYIHFIADPFYFVPPSMEMAHVKDFYDNLSAIDENLFLAVPHEFYKISVDRIKNKHIEIISFPTVAFDSFFEKNIPFLSDGLISCGVQNVTNAAIGYAITAGYKEISVFGFDLSASFSVDENNIVIYGNEHYYKSEKKPWPYSMKDRYKFFYLMYSQLEALNMYAECIGATIYNHSKYSLVDTFKKVW